MENTFLHTLLNILKCLSIFYSVYYVVGSLFYAGFKLQHFDGKIPFNFKTWIDLSLCCTGYSNDRSVNVLSMEVCYAVSGLIFGAVINRWVWDYSITITLIHIALSCLVMLDFPMNWSWWVCLGFGLFMMISLGEAVSFGRRKRQKVKITPEIQLQEPKSYLFRKK